MSRNREGQIRITPGQLCNEMPYSIKFFKKTINHWPNPIKIYLDSINIVPTEFFIRHQPMAVSGPPILLVERTSLSRIPLNWIQR